MGNLNVIEKIVPVDLCVENYTKTGYTDSHDATIHDLEMIQEESESEPDVCNVCLEPLDSFPECIITKCNHTFCKECLEKIFQYKSNPPFIHCPTCRKIVPRQIFTKMPPLSELYIEPDFSWITSNNNREIIETAYTSVTRLKKWKLMQEFEPKSNEGFMGCSHPPVVDLMSDISHKYGHSGASLAYTMRTMQKIARIGVEEFKRDYLENISN
jgi:Ring finger domain